jgi:RNA polymerase sigma-70 factor (ECF subfamily)
VTTFRRLDVLSPIAAERPWCNNERGARILRHPGKQLLSPRCLSILSGHRGQVDLGPLCKSCLGPSFYRWTEQQGGPYFSSGPERPAVSDWASALSWGRDEADLVHELQAGSETAFDWLVTHYHAPVYNLILGMLGDTSDAADGAQEVFLKAFRGIRNFRQGSSLKTWLYRIAIREALNHKRWFKRHVQKNVSIDAEPQEGQARIEIEDLGATPFDQLASLEIRVVVQAALQQVPDVFRSAVILRDLEGLSYEEVSEVLECSVGTVKSRILRGRRALKEILEPLLGAHQIHGSHAQTSSHGSVSEPQPSPFGDAFSAARRITISSQGLSPRASSAGKGVQ